MEFLIDLFKAIIYGIVEGVTEWLPISSTGHLILLEKLLPLQVSPQFSVVFKVVIQLGAILAVILLYFNKLNFLSPKKTKEQNHQTVTIWLKVLIATLPAMVLGFLFDDFLEAHLMNHVTVSLMLITYGVLFLVVENRLKERTPRITHFNQLTYQTALLIGFFQVLALIPGTSRSGATIIGALLLGTSRYIATEFSFFLGIPVLFGASLLKLVKSGLAFGFGEWALLLVAMAVSFVVSVAFIKLLIGYIKKHDFKIFGYYRIALGVVVLILLSFL